MAAFFKKKISEQDVNASGSAPALDQFQKSKISAGDLYGMRSKDINAPADASSFPQAQEFQVPRAQLRGPITPPSPNLPRFPGFQQQSFSPAYQDTPQPIPAPVPLPRSAPMGPSRYREEASYPEPIEEAPMPEELPEPPAPNSDFSDDSNYNLNEQQDYSVPEPLPPAPAQMPAYQQEYSTEPELHAGEQVELLTEDLEKIARGIIDEKLQEVTETISKLQEIKNVAEDIENLKTQVSAITEKVDSLQKSIISKVDDYNKSINDVNAELTAVGKVFEKLIPEFTKDVGELKGVIDKKLNAPRRSPGRPRKRKRKSKKK